MECWSDVVSGFSHVVCWFLSFASKVDPCRILGDNCWAVDGGLQGPFQCWARLKSASFVDDVPFPC